MDTEYWKDIPDYAGFYQASNFGEIRSLDRTVNNGRRLKGVVLKNGINTGGYYTVTLAKEGCNKTFLVHQLVAMAFIGHKPNNFEFVVNHIDFDRLNNKVVNLEIVTQRSNANKIHLKSTSKYIGVSWYKSSKKWTSKILVKGKPVALGYFDNELEASEYYQNALKNIELGHDIKIKVSKPVVKGVYWRPERKRWVAYMFVDKKRKKLGSFINESDAVYAYEKAIKQD